MSGRPPAARSGGGGTLPGREAGGSVEITDIAPPLDQGKGSEPTDVLRSSGQLAAATGNANRHGNAGARSR